jgi:AraC-like DNA-binding protein
MIESIQFILSAAVLVSSILSLTVFLGFGFDRSFFNVGASMILLFILTRSWMFFLYSNDWLLMYPHFLLVINSISRFIFPLLYLMVWNHVTSKKIRPIHIIHFIPSFLFLLNFLPVFLLSGAEKQIILIEIEQNGFNYAMNKGYFQLGMFLTILRFGIPLVYVFFTFRLVFLYGKNDFLNDDKLKFGSATLVYIFMNILMPFVEEMFQIGLDTLSLVTKAGLISSLIFNVWLFFMPRFMFRSRYNPHTMSIDFHERENSKSLSDTTVRSINSNQEKGHLKFLEIENIIDLNKPYINPDFNLRALSKLIQMPEKNISLSIKSNTGHGFVSYINHKRIKYFLEICKNNESLNNEVIEDVINSVGFRSKVTFNRYFKVVTNMTLNSYMIQLATLRKETLTRSGD